MSEIRLPPDSLIGDIQREDKDAPISDATRYSADEIGDGLAYRFPVGTLEKMKYLTADMLLECCSTHPAVPPASR